MDIGLNTCRSLGYSKSSSDWLYIFTLELNMNVLMNNSFNYIYLHIRFSKLCNVLWKWNIKTSSYHWIFVACYKVAWQLQNVFQLHLRDYWCSIIQTLQEWSSLFVHIVSIFKFNQFCSMALKWFSFLKLFQTSHPIPLKQFEWNFTGLISSSKPCAYLTGL